MTTPTSHSDQIETEPIPGVDVPICESQRQKAQPQRSKPSVKDWTVRMGDEQPPATDDKPLRDNEGRSLKDISAWEQAGKDYDDPTMIRQQPPATDDKPALDKCVCGHSRQAHTWKGNGCAITGCDCKAFQVAPRGEQEWTREHDPNYATSRAIIRCGTTPIVNDISYYAAGLIVSAHNAALSAKQEGIDSFRNMWSIACEQLAAEREQTTRAWIAARQYQQQLTAEREKLKSLVDALLKIMTMDSPWPARSLIAGEVHDVASDALAKVKE